MPANGSHPRQADPGHSPLAVRVLLVLIHPRTNRTPQALAALFHTSQSAVDRILHHLAPVLAQTLRPDPDATDGPWITDGTLISVQDQSITAISNDYRRSVNAQVIICADRCRVVAVGCCWPGNHNDVVAARHTVRVCSRTSVSSSAMADTAASTPSPRPRGTDPDGSP